MSLYLEYMCFSRAYVIHFKSRAVKNKKLITKELTVVFYFEILKSNLSISQVEESFFFFFEKDSCCTVSRRL